MRTRWWGRRHDTLETVWRHRFLGCFVGFQYKCKDFEPRLRRRRTLQNDFLLFVDEISWFIQKHGGASLPLRQSDVHAVCGGMLQSAPPLIRPVREKNNCSLITLHRPAVIPTAVAIYSTCSSDSSGTCEPPSAARSQSSYLTSEGRRMINPQRSHWKTLRRALLFKLYVRLMLQTTGNVRTGPRWWWSSPIKEN